MENRPRGWDGGFSPKPLTMSAAPEAVVISGAGDASVNGIYKATPQMYCDAPIYEHTVAGQDLKITREPHTSPKTGVVKYGWLLGKAKVPLYGVPTKNNLIPTTGWKQFGGPEPVPQVVVHAYFAEVFYTEADDAKAKGEACMDQEDWKNAIHVFTAGLDAMSRSGERFGDAFSQRAALLLSRRGRCNARIEDWKAALRDAIASLELARGLSAAEAVALEASTALGCPNDSSATRFVETLGNGRVLDTGAPLVLRCVDRWVNDLVEMWESNLPSAALPEPRHLPSDRYLPGVDDKEREKILKKHLPEYFQVPGGTGIIKDASECLTLMRRWEEVFSSSEFQRNRREIWERRDLNFPMRLEEFRRLVATSLADILEPMGFAPGQPGLTRVVRQMQTYWSKDRACASKALDLEEMADVSIADLQTDAV